MKSKLPLLIIIALALFLRTYRPADFLGFWFDQGRDALAIWNFLYVDHKPFLIGPTTGIEGIFLGPFYYYLIAPFYLLGRGDPVFPAVGLGLITTAAVFLIYRVTADYFNPKTGLLAAFLYGLSYHTVSYHRWLSNPAPLPFFAILAFWSLLQIIHSTATRFTWVILGLAIGLSLQLEAASAIFFLPATAITLFSYRKSYILNRRHAFLGLTFFLITLVPQLAFNFRHQNIIGQAFARFLVAENSFQPALTDLLSQRLAFYYEIFTNKFFFYVPTNIAFIVITLTLGVLVFRRLESKTLTASLIWILTPVVLLLFYHGNKGYVWDYYFTGVYPQVFMLVAAVWLAAYRHIRIAIPAVLILLTMFIYQNLRNHILFLSQPLPGFISLTPIVRAVDWVYEDAAGSAFNTDVYVPPVIAHAYDYVFLWRGTTKYHTSISAPLVTRLYTLLEPDSTHPQLRDTWLVRQSRLGSIETEKQFGPITVQRRHRFQNSP